MASIYSVWRPERPESPEEALRHLAGSSLPQETQREWLKITYTGDVRFHSVKAAVGDARTVWPYGPVRGIVSNPRLHLYVLIRMIRRTPFGSSPTDYLAGTGWRISEGIVEASGNWRAGVCFTPYVYPEKPPDFEYWEVLAVATPDADSIREGIVHQICGISEEDLRHPSALVCSESRIIMRPPDRGGYYIDHREAPKPRRYCFGRDDSRG
jgi:hypothetical protein